MDHPLWNPEDLLERGSVVVDRGLATIGCLLVSLQVDGPIEPLKRSRPASLTHGPTNSILLYFSDRLDEVYVFDEICAEWELRRTLPYQDVVYETEQLMLGAALVHGLVGDESSLQVLTQPADWSPDERPPWVECRLGSDA